MEVRIAELEAQLGQSHRRIAKLEADNAELRAWIGKLQRQAKGKTPQNSSLPLERTVSARQAAAASEQVEMRTRRSARPPEAPAGLDSRRAARRGGAAQAKAVSALGCEAFAQRSASAASSGVGSAPDRRFAWSPRAARAPRAGWSLAEPVG